MYNVAVIGLGMGKDHLRGYSAIPDVRIAAAADLAEERLQACGEAFHIPQLYKDYHELLACPDIDAVSVCLPNYLHAPVVSEALQAGKHVLVEKPMARTASEASAMVAQAKAAGRTLAVSFNYRWSYGPDSWYLKHLIEQGRLGSIYYIRAVSLRRRTFRRGQKSWFSQKELSGGAAAMDMGPHMLDLAMWLAGDYEPLQVSGVARTAIMTDTDVDDFATALVRLRHGVTVHLESTWEAHTRPWLGLTVMGTEGGVIFDMNGPEEKRLTIFGHEGESLLETVPADIILQQPPDMSVQDHFVKCLRQGCQPQNSAACGLAVMRIIDAIYQSSASGRDVILQETALGG